VSDSAWSFLSISDRKLMFLTTHDILASFAGDLLA
jgi:hypothetical protein